MKTKRWKKQFAGTMAALLIVGGTFATGCGDAGSSTSATNTGSSGEQIAASSTVEEAQNTLEIEDTEGLHLSSVYTSTILNPDAENASGEEIGSLEVTNTTERYLSRAELVATLSDGKELHFHIDHLPAGAKAEIFDTENQTIDAGVTCTSVKVEEETYTDENNPLSDVVTYTNSDDYTVEITNTGDETLENLIVVYHGQMADAYFGGTSLQTEIASLAAGETYTLTDENLFSGIAVVDVHQ